MRIGLDASTIPARRSGAGNYAFHLVRWLARVDHVNTYVVFAKRQHIEEWGITARNVICVVADLPIRGARLLWEQTVLPRLVRAYRLDVLHSPHYTMPLRCPSKRVVTFHDATFITMPELHERSKRLFFPPMMRWSGQRADRIIANSASTCRDIIAHCGIAPERIDTVPIAAAADHVPATRAQITATCQRYTITPDGYVLYVGVLEPRKNVPHLITAFARLASEMPELALVIAGQKGWMYDAIFAQVTALGLHERVRFLGFVPDADLPGLYGGALAFAYPSRYEGFGIPVLEAMQCGAPVVTSNVSSLPEVAGDAALLVAPDDVEGLAGALRRLIVDRALARALVARGLERATQFSWERTARASVGVYDRAVHSGRQ